MVKEASSSEDADASLCHKETWKISGQATRLVFGHENPFFRELPLEGSCFYGFLIPRAGLQVCDLITMDVSSLICQWAPDICP